MSTVAEALADVRARLARAADRAGRDPSSVTLVAVSKTVAVEAVREAYAAGGRVFGENYVQELAAKARATADLPDIEWHLIGHLQRNKVRDALHARLVHTVDSVRLVEALAAKARPGDLHPAELRSSGTPGLRVLVQVDLAGEAQKAGALPEELDGILAAIAATGGRVRALGLMTMPPLEASQTDARPFFRLLRELRDAHGGPEELPHLSMGMSHDFEQAVEEGATLVRVGTAIFGRRG